MLVFYFIEYAFTDKRVNVAIQPDVKPIPLSACFDPQPTSDDAKQLTMPPAFIEQLTMLIYVVTYVVKTHKALWPAGDQHKVCVLYSGSVCVRVCKVPL